MTHRADTVPVPVRRAVRVALALLVAIAVLPAAASAAGTAPSPREITISRAIDLLQSGRAESAVLIGTAGAPDLRIVVDGQPPLVAATTSDLTPDIVRAARAGDVPLTVERPTVPADTAGAAADTGGFDVGAWLQTWGPLLLLGALVAVSAMALRTATGGRFKTRTRVLSSDVRFEDVAGVDEIRDEVAEIADALRNPGRYDALGARLPRGVILYGPPGTGKTLLAKAVAGEAGVPFFSAAGSEFVEMYAGLGSRRIRQLFAAARKAAPAVVYIDEIDAVGGRRTGHASSGEREQTLDQLLAEMDGFRTDPSKPVVVLASTNRLEELDPALVRSGRFDRKIAVGLPDRAARREIIDVHLRERPLAPTADAAHVAAMTAGMAGADLAALCNEAAFEAARSGDDSIDLPHFRRALLRLAAGPEKRSRVLSDEERRLVAYHEIGHALAGHLSATCDPVERVTVIPQGHALGVTISLPVEDRFLATRTECMERLTMMLAGRAAEELVFGEFTSGAADDLNRAASLARRMAGELAMSSARTDESILTGLPGAAPGGRAAEEVERAAQQLVRDAFTRATELLSANRELLDRAAGILLDREALEGEEITALFGPRPDGTRLRPVAAAAGTV